MREVLTVPDPRLRQVSAEIKEITPAVRELAMDMLEIVKGNCVGMAAPQVGELLRLIVIDYEGRQLIFLNPVLITYLKMRWIPETCESIPKKTFLAQRPKIVKVRGLNLNGETRAAKVHGTLAQAVAHEIDHLDGLLINRFKELYV